MLSGHRRFLRALCTFAIICFFTPSIRLTAQQYSTHEITVGTNFQTYGMDTCTPIGDGPFCTPGVEHAASFQTPSIAYTFNLSPSLALEGTVVPTSPFRKTNRYGSGRETLALSGAKTGWRGKDWGVYGEIQVGIGSFSCGNFFYDPVPYSRCSRITNFALEYGGTVQRRIARRWALRLDAGHLMMPEFDQILTRDSNGLSASGRDGEWLQHFDARLGITRSFGEIHESGPEPDPNRSAWDFGALFALQPRVMRDDWSLNPYPSAGIWGSWNFSPHVSWDTTVLHGGRKPGKYAFADYQEGGRSLEALTGLKAGIRRDHMGYFGKIRGGTITFGETERRFIQLSPGVLKLERGMFTNAVLDAGGVLEVYPSKHSILRFDAGSATIFYQPKNIVQVNTTYAIPGYRQTMMLMSFGAGLRF